MPFRPLSALKKLGRAFGAQVKRVDDRVKAVDDMADGGADPGTGTVQVVVAIVAAVIAGMVSLSVALRQYGPTVHPDEWGFLLNGQVIMGRSQAPIPTGSFYPAGFGLVTGPLAVLTGSLSGAFRATLIVNFGLCIGVAWAAYGMARKVMHSTRQVAVLAAALTFVVPGTIVSSLFAWPETAARLVFLGFVIWFHAVARTPRAGRMIPFALYVGLMPGLHGRFTLVLPVVCLVFLWWGQKRDVRPVLAIGACAVTTFGYSLGYLLNKYVKDRLYGDSYDQENRLLRRLVDPSVWPALIRTMTGQTWYLIGTSAGLVVVAAAFMISRVRAGGGVRSVRTDADRLTMFVVATSSVLLIFTGGLQLLYGNRGDHLIYGRYVEILVPVLLVIAVCALATPAGRARVSWLRGVVLTVVVAFLYVVVDAGDGVKGGWVRRDIVFPNIVGTDAIRYLVRPGFLTFAAAFGAIGLVLWFIAARRGTWSIVAMVVILAIGSSYSAERSVLNRTDDLKATKISVDYVRQAGGSLIGFDMGVRNDRSYYYLRYKLDPIKLVRFNISGPDAVIPAEYSCVFGFPNKPPSQGEWRIVADEKVLQRVLFQRVGKDHC